MEIELKQPFDPAQAKQILERRRELYPVRYSERSNGVKQELTDMLKETDPTSPRLRRGKEQFTLQDVKDVIYNEEDNDDMIYPIGYRAIQRGKVVAMFDRGGDASELSNVLELVTDAWNYFPHKVLGGISPAEKLLEHPQ